MKDLVKDLNEFLADLNVYYRKFQNYHWNIQGKSFFIMHTKLEEYYNEINEQIDEIAEHILILGYQPLGRMQDYLEISNVKEADNVKIEMNTVLDEIISSFVDLNKKVENIKMKADNQNCYSTSSLMDEYISSYKKKIWMLNQSKGNN